MKKITTTQLNKIINNKNTVLLNVLPEESFKYATLPKSKNACIYKTSFEDDVSKIIQNKETEIVVFGWDSKHEAGNEAVKSLEEMGYKNVYLYREGVLGWKKSGGKIVGNKKEPIKKLNKKNYSVNTKESYLNWEGSNVLNKHHGSISIKNGQIKAVGNNLKIGEIVLDMNKITCEDIKDKKTNGYLINHLKSSDFFDVKNYPEASIKIKSFKKISNIESSLNYQVDSLITIKGITNPVKFKIHGHIDNNRLIAQGDLVLDRTKWNVKYGSSRFFEWLGMHLVNDQIRLRFKIVAE